MRSISRAIYVLAATQNHSQMICQRIDLGRLKHNSNVLTVVAYKSTSNLRLPLHMFLKFTKLFNRCCISTARVSLY